MNQHTKGPWTAKVGSSGQTHLSAEKSHWYQFATVITCLAETHPDDEVNNEGKANARLIAAAPELLEALQAVYAGCVNSGNDKRLVLNMSIEAWRSVEAAIAKATGGAN